MNSEVEQTRYWMWARRKFSTRPLPPLVNSPISNITPSSSYHESWEEQAFAEDSAGLLGGCIWPPRSYTCSFCQREFRSAQALGGHMNVHRRDRARLKQSSSPTDDGSEQYQDKVSPLEDYITNPKPNPSSRVIASSLPSARENTFVSPPYTSPLIKDQRNNSLLLRASSFSNPILIRAPGGLGLKLELGNWRMMEVGSKGNRDWEEDVEIMCSTNKRMRTDAVLNSIVKPSSSDCLQIISPPEVLKLSPSPVEELDLELRLGGPPKIK